jgi:hypothetical protein
MSEVIPEAQREFWRPPVMRQDAAVIPGMVDVCAGCSTEFIVGSHFCHVCGVARGTHLRNGYWSHLLEFLHLVEFQDLKHWLGLGTPPLIAFLVGIFCFLGAILAGTVSTVRNFEDFQVVQYWRMEWLLAAIVAFVAGVLLKSPVTTEK